MSSQTLLQHRYTISYTHMHTQHINKSTPVHALTKQSAPAPVHPGMGSPCERWKHFRPGEHCPSLSHSPVHAFRFLALPSFVPDNRVGTVLPRTNTVRQNVLLSQQQQQQQQRIANSYVSDRSSSPSLDPRPCPSSREWVRRVCAGNTSGHTNTVHRCRTRPCTLSGSWLCYRSCRSGAEELSRVMASWCGACNHFKRTALGLGKAQQLDKAQCMAQMMLTATNHEQQRTTRVIAVVPIQTTS